VAGEGSFCVTRKLPPATDGSVRLRFVFTVTMASRDRALLEDLRDFLGYGSIDDQPARKPHWQPTSTFTIGSIRGHRMATIPFAEQYLLASAKRRQFERWRDAMDSYEVAKPTHWGKGPLGAPSRDVMGLCAGRAFAGLITTVPRATDTRAAYFSGFVCAEGSFIRSGNSFRFAVSLGATDAASCSQLADFLSVGTITTSRRRRAHYDDEVSYHVQALPDLIDVVVPFMDTHLPASYKRDQYLVWRAALLDYWELDARRVRPCAVPGCGEPRRIKGLCRPHFRATVP